VNPARRITSRSSTATKPAAKKVFQSQSGSQKVKIVNTIDLACDIRINPSARNTTIQNISIDQPLFNIGWSTNKPVNYTINLINRDNIRQEFACTKNGKKIKPCTGRTAPGDQIVGLSTGDIFQEDYAAQAREWPNAFKEQSYAFDKNEDGLVDTTDYAIFYQKWMNDMAQFGIEITAQEYGCEQSYTWAVAPDLYIPKVTAYPGARAISEPINVELSGTENIFYVINNNNNFKAYTEAITVYPDETLVFYGENSAGVQSPIQYITYNKKIEILSTIKALINKALSRSITPQESGILRKKLMQESEKRIEPIPERNMVYQIFSLTMELIYANIIGTLQ